jgi:hypothetical protein
VLGDDTKTAIKNKIEALGIETVEPYKYVEKTKKYVEKTKQYCY